MFWLFSLHLQYTLTTSLQRLSGHSTELFWWQGSEHWCSQLTLGFGHFWVQSWQGPEWHTLAQEWMLQERAFLQKRPHETALWKQGTVVIVSCPPWHWRLTNSVQGGHPSGSSWHWWVGGCEHWWSRAQGSVQVGRFVPHFSGGYSTCLPQLQNISVQITLGQDLQNAWHGSSQLWVPQSSLRPKL